MMKKIWYYSLSVFLLFFVVAPNIWAAEMTNYERDSLILTGLYDIITLCLLVFVIYEAIVKPKIPNIVFYLETLPGNTKRWPVTAQLADFILENRGVELRNIEVTSEPDELGWGIIGAKNEKVPTRTSKYFSRPIPFVRTSEKLQFLYCNLNNNDAWKKPFKIILEFDNPIPFARLIKKKYKKEFPFDFRFYKNINLGVTSKFSIHNVAIELTRIRELIEERYENSKENDFEDSPGN